LHRATVTLAGGANVVVVAVVVVVVVVAVIWHMSMAAIGLWALRAVVHVDLAWA